MTIPAPIILLVDDDPNALEILCRFLDLLIHHAEIVTVSSGTAALAVMASREVALVIADYRMPEMNGVQLATVIKAASPATRVAIVSAEDSDDMERLAKIATVEYVLLKSFRLVELQQIIEESFPLAGRP